MINEMVDKVRSCMKELIEIAEIEEYDGYVDYLSAFLACLQLDKNISELTGIWTTELRKQYYVRYGSPKSKKTSKIYYSCPVLSYFNRLFGMLDNRNQSDFSKLLPVMLAIIIIRDGGGLRITIAELGIDPNLCVSKLSDYFNRINNNVKAINPANAV